MYKSQNLKWILLLLIGFIILSLYWLSRSIALTVYIGNNVSVSWDDESNKFFITNDTITLPHQISVDTNPNQNTHEKIPQLKLSHFNNEFTHLIRRYLTPVTKALHEDISINDSISEHILRSGLGLEPYTTEKKEYIWIENGVQYRPYPFLEKADNPFYTSEFEAFVPFNKTEFFQRDEKSLSRDITDKKIILWWQHKIAQAPITGLNPLRACPDFPCVVTSDRKYTENSSALIINVQFVNNERPPPRRLDQVFVHYQIEAPFNYWFYGYIFDPSKGWNDVFNWTMSYRMDADIVTYHGIVRRRRVEKKKNYQDILAKKKGLIAWMVSSCGAHSRRQDYVKELQKYIPVDIYGKCGPFKCSRDKDKNCLQEITLKYKFYLGFENNFCKDYITEKLYKYLDSDMIVIARGYNTYSRILPSEIFLNTANFKSPKELADRILYLNSHDEEYLHMLQEKDKYFAVYEDYPLTNVQPTFLEHRYEAVAMCELCQRLWNLEKYSKQIPDMKAWFHKKEYQCQGPSDI
ncbi:glycoprotein 3-alpha-L-fucosyltransferase A isoform X1 [Biomphalaria glabrata]|nr:glycoprotein 3-alpha-L-fucosyltransferase A isoform X1 [Biomphalaria glabrata]